MHNLDIPSLVDLMIGITTETFRNYLYTSYAPFHTSLLLELVESATDQDFFAFLRGAMSKLKGMKYVRLLKLTEEEVAKEAEQYENTNPYKKVEVQKAAPAKGEKQTFLKGLTKGVKKLVTTKLEDL